MFADRGIELKSPEQLDLMRRAGLVVGRTLEHLATVARAGTTTAELDAVAEDLIRSSGATPSFKGYADPPYPATLCISVDDEVVHGIPGDRVLRDGDLVSIDCGAVVEGWHGDAAVTVAVGQADAAGAELSRVTEEAMWQGIAAARLGGRVGDVSHAVQTHVEQQGRYGIVADYTGHGIGSALHQPPNVPNLGRRGRGPRIREGMALAIEPMVVLGSPETVVLEDEWTVVTRDGSRAAHWEHTITVTPQGTWVLTAVDGGEERLAALGVPFGGRS